MSSVPTPDRRAPGNASVIEIRLLGQFAVEHDGQEIAPGSFGGRLARRLLRLLTLRRGILVPKELIADVLWPDVLPADPAGNIEVLVSRIRRALDDRALIRTGSGGYVLADGEHCRVDTEDFLTAVKAGRASLAARPGEALPSFRAALDIWRGDPLPEDTYADWAEAERRHLILAHLEALDGAATAALETHGPAAATEAASWAREALVADPLRESSVLLLVRALAALGNPAGASAAFDEYRDRLAAETDLAPTLEACQVRETMLARHADGTYPPSPRWREMLGMLALLGRPAPPALLAAAAGSSLHSVLDTLEGLGSAGLASPGPHGWVLGDDLLRQVITAALCPAETSRLRAMLGRALRECRNDPAVPECRSAQQAGRHPPNAAR